MTHRERVLAALDHRQPDRVPLPSLPDFPVRAVLPDLAGILAANRCAVLQAPPGTGKTTLVAPALLDEPWLCGRRILLLEPRRLAARAAARFMARALGEEVGGRVGYHVRLERRVGAQTRIEVLTEGLLTRRLLAAPDLPEAGLVVFDEFHERNLAADVAFAFAVEARRALRPDLRILVMSATLDPAPVARHLGSAKIVTVEAHAWPVETRLLERASRAPLPEQAAEAVRRAWPATDGSLLVFLPGEGEIRRTAALLAPSRLPGAVVHPLYGALPRGAQDAALDPPPPGRRKIVLATSIAESSLTIRDVRAVIDCGWMRVPRFSPRSGMSRLETVRVTRDRADQRRGRAGREGPGVCYRLWDEATDRALSAECLPEILDADLAPTVLQVLDWGARQREDLPWLTPPPDAAWRQALDLLRLLGACDAANRITRRGRRMAGWPVHPRLGQMILRADEYGCGQRACLLAAAIEEATGETDVRGETDAETLLDRVGAAYGPQPEEPSGDRHEWRRRARLLAAQWGRLLAAKDTGSVGAGRLLSWAFPDRIARRRGAGGRYLLTGGRGACLSPADPLARAEWLVAAEVQDEGPDARIRLAAAVSSDDVEHDFAASFERVSSVVWDRREEAVRATVRTMLGAIVVREAPLPDADPALARDALIEGIRAKGVTNLPWTRPARNLIGRIRFLARVEPEAGWPDVSETALDRTLDEWLGHALDGLSRWSDLLRRLDIAAALLAWIGPRRHLLDAHAPTHVTVPSGSRLPIVYDEGDDPILAVRIQEMFGATAAPRVADGRVPVLLRLLSPASRPVQVTKDLAGFWQTSYAAVRRELRGRYPRHEWPEDPARARPTRGARRAGAGREDRPAETKGKRT
jgi:ATP-dependent helicase HrpB